MLSVLPLKKRGEKGWRELQGDYLRDLLLELIRKEVVTKKEWEWLLLWMSRKYIWHFKTTDCMMLFNKLQPVEPVSIFVQQHSTCWMYFSTLNITWYTVKHCLLNSHRRSTHVEPCFIGWTPNIMIMWTFIFLFVHTGRIDQTGRGIHREGPCCIPKAFLSQWQWPTQSASLVSQP